MRNLCVTNCVCATRLTVLSGGIRDSGLQEIAIFCNQGREKISGTNAVCICFSAVSLSLVLRFCTLFLWTRYIYIHRGDTDVTRFTIKRFLTACDRGRRFIDLSNSFDCRSVHLTILNAVTTRGCVVNAKNPMQINRYSSVDFAKIPALLLPFAENYIRFKVNSLINLIFFNQIFQILSFNMTTETKANNNL